MNSGLSDDAAIKAALSQNWKAAVTINTFLSQQDDKNIEAVNRLGFAYMQLGQFTRAKRIYQKVITIDPYNQIALKNIRKLGSMKKMLPTTHRSSHLTPALFLEEPGKTKIVSCVNLAPATDISSLTPGEEVFLKVRSHCIEVRSKDNTYQAALPDDLAFKLIKLISGGNKYIAIVKSADKKVLMLLVREVSRGKKFAHQPSFISTTTGYAGLSRSDGDTIDKPDVTPTGELDEDDVQPIHQEE